MTEAIGAFTEEQTEALASVSRHQLREWSRRGLLKPSIADDAHVPYGRLYSFRDLVSARVLGQLRNVHRVSLPDLVKTHRKLAGLSDEPWASTTLYVLGRQVVVAEAGSRRRVKVLEGQQVLDIPLKVVIGSVRQGIAKLNERGPEKVGKVVRDRFVAQNQPVIAGTRIPVAAVQSFAASGYGSDRILKEYPSLTADDVAAALAFGGGNVAA